MKEPCDTTPSFEEAPDRTSHPDPASLGAGGRHARADGDAVAQPATHRRAIRSDIDGLSAVLNALAQRQFDLWGRLDRRVANL
jgi:hypothetical protein